ncbi:MAG: biotin transporter BioY, partial [Selenomonadaceae bacterium]|nr:biotin transporter BioY [Selenomonadaceae bacterium]
MSVRELVLAGLFVALITVGTFIRIQIGADFYTLQFLFTLLAGLVLGERLGALAVGAYVLLGLLGVPV